METLRKCIQESSVTQAPVRRPELDKKPARLTKLFQPVEAEGTPMLAAVIKQWKYKPAVCKKRRNLYVHPSVVHSNGCLYHHGRQITVRK
jgi:hypothetical protein